MTVDLKLTRADEVDERNPVAGDLHVDGVDFALVRGVDAAVQEVEVLLAWWLGEWFLDRRRGVPYLRLLQKGVALETVRAVLSRQIRRAPDVRQVERFALELDALTRRLSGHAEIRVDDGSPRGLLRTAEVG